MHYVWKIFDKEESEAAITLSPESGGRTIVELSNEFAVKVRHEILEETLSIDEQIEALVIIDSLKSDLKQSSHKKEEVLVF